MRTLQVAILVVSRLLKPLGNPPPNGIKYFATADLLEIAKDRAWLVKASMAIWKHWQHQNEKKCRSVTASRNGLLAAIRKPGMIGVCVRNQNGVHRGVHLNQPRHLGHMWSV